MSKKIDYFHSLSQLSREFGATQDEAKLLNLIVNAAAETIKAKAASLALLTEESESYRRHETVAQVGLSDKYVHSGWGHVGKIIPQLIKEGFIYYRNATTDSRLTNHELKKAEGIGSILTLPLMTKGKVLGVITIYTSQIREFSKEEIEFLSILATQAAVAIENVHLLQKLRDYAQMFSKLATSISSSLDVKNIFQALTEDIAKGFQVKAASVRLLDEETQTLKLVASYGLSEKYLNKGAISAEKSIATAMRGKPVVVKNAATDDGVQYKKEKKEEGIVSILCVPIKVKDDVIGVLRLYTDHETDFTKDDITLVTALASQGGMAIQNASCYLNVQNDLKDLKDNIWSYKSWF